jgi:AraC-like DNA-binding protein
MKSNDEAASARAAEGDFSYARASGLDGVELLEARASRKRWRVLHETFAFCTIRSGGAQFEYRRRTHDAEEGTTHLLEPGNIHRDLRAAPRNDFDVVFISADTVASALGVPVERVPHLKDGLSRSPLVACAVRALAEDCKHAGTPMAMRSSLSELVGTIFADHAEASQPWLARPDLRPVVRLIQMHYTEPLSLEDLAAAAKGVTTFHLIRSFRSTFGLTPHQYIIQQRIARARKLLQRPGANVAAVAVEVGFGDQSHLHRHFVSTLGVTPGQYARALGGL